MSCEGRPRWTVVMGRGRHTCTGTGRRVLLPDMSYDRYTSHRCTYNIKQLSGIGGLGRGTLALQAQAFTYKPFNIEPSH